MNIYQLFREASNRSILNRKKLLEIREKYCPDIPVSFLEAHRKIYHQQLYLNYWHPVDRHAPISDVGSYIDVAGNIKATGTRLRHGDEWRTISVYPLRDPDNKSALAHKYRTDSGFAEVIDIFSDRTVHPVFINELTIPKWEPRSKTICMDKRTDFTRNVERLMKYSVVVLRCKPLEEENQYQLWTLSRKTKVFKVQIATIINNSIGLGKTQKGSKRSGLNKNAKQVTERLGE